jgi:hypothetical protein
MWPPTVKPTIMLGLCAAFLIWTVVRLSRRRIDSEWADIVYRGGVRYMGVTGAVMMPVAFWFEIYWRDNQAPPFSGMLFIVLFTTPLCLWVGYWGGRMTASIRGVRKP